jgi:hypothetical protein
MRAPYVSRCPAIRHKFGRCRYFEWGWVVKREQVRGEKAGVDPYLQVSFCFFEWAMQQRQRRTKDTRSRVHADDLTTGDV